MSTPPAARGGARERQSAEARRILGLLDRDGPIAVEPGGRPYFADGHADFSISHSRDMAAVAWLANDGGAAARRVGCDIQRVDPRKSYAGISSRFFAAGEREYIAAGGGNSEQSRRFCSLWVLKEAWLKLRGLSVFEMAAAPAFAVGRERGAAAPAADFFLYEIESPAGELYLLAAVRERSQPDCPPPELRWFSEPALPVVTHRRLSPV